MGLGGRGPETMRMTYSGARFRPLQGLHTLWTPCTVAGPPSHLGQGFKSITESDSGRYRVEVNVSKQRTLTGRILRVAAVSGIALGAMAPAIASAAPYPGGGDPPPVVDPNTQVKGATATKASTLPFTGGDAAGLAAIGVGAVAAGAVFVRQSRRRATV